MEIRKCSPTDKKVVLLKQSFKRSNSRKTKTFLKGLEKINQGSEYPGFSRWLCNTFSKETFSIKDSFSIGNKSRTAKTDRHESERKYSKREVLINTFFNAQFNYCSLIWMLHRRQNNNKIRHSHERYLRLIHNDEMSSYEELLEKDGSVSINHKNILSVVIEMFQIKHGQSPEIVRDICTQTTQHYIFRQTRDFRIRSVKSVYHGSKNISYFGPKIWEIVPAKIKKPIPSTVSK